MDLIEQTLGRAWIVDREVIGEQAATAQLAQSLSPRRLGEYLFSVLRAAGRPVGTLRPYPGSQLQ